MDRAGAIDLAAIAGRDIPFGPPGAQEVAHPDGTVTPA